MNTSDKDNTSKGEKPETEGEKEEQKLDNSLDIIFPNLKTIQLGKIKCKVKRLKFNQTISLLQIITNTYPALNWNNFAKEPVYLVNIIFLSITKALSSFYAFIDGMLECGEEDREQLKDYIRNDMENDEILNFVEALYEQEKNNFSRWLKKVVGMFKVPEMVKIINQKK